MRSPTRRSPRQGFWTPRDLVQVKYEIVRRVRMDGDTVDRSASTFGFTRPCSPGRPRRRWGWRRWVPARRAPGRATSSATLVAFRRHQNECVTLEYAPALRKLRRLWPLLAEGKSMDSAALASTAETLSDQVLGRDAPDPRRTRKLAVRHLLWWAISRPFRLGNIDAEVKRYQAATGYAVSRARQDVVWVKTRLIRLAATDCADRERLVRCASKRLLRSKATSIDCSAVKYTEEVFSESHPGQVPEGFRQWPVEQRTEWFRSKISRYADAWRAALEQDGENID